MPIQTGKDIEQAAELLLRTWSDPNRPLTALPEPLRPANLAHAYGVQQAVSQRLGHIGGWIVWQSHAIGGLLCAPIPLASLHPSPARLASELWTCRRLVPRICLRIGASLPDYDAPYNRDRIIAAIECCHAAVEVRQPRFADASALDALTALADSVGYGCLVQGRQGTPWRGGVALHGDVRIVMGNTEMPARVVDAGLDVIEALRWLANDGTHWAGGLMVGHVVAIEAGTHEIQAPPDVPVRVIIDSLGSAEVRFNHDKPRSRPAHRLLREWVRRWMRN